MNVIEFAPVVFLGKHIIKEPFRIVSGIIPCKEVQHVAEIFSKAELQHIQRAADHREVEIKDLEIPLLTCGVAGNPQPLEELMKMITLIDIIVGAEHAQEDTLAEAAWAYEEEEVVCVLHQRKIHRLIDEIEVLAPQLLEVRDAVGKKLYRCHGMIVLD